MGREADHMGLWSTGVVSLKIGIQTAHRKGGLETLRGDQAVMS